MMKLTDFYIKIPNAEIATQTVEYSLNDRFFSFFENKLPDLSNLQVEVQVTLTKERHTMQLQFIIKGSIGLICDRTLEGFDYPINIDHHIYYKIGDKYEELAVDLYTISRQASTIDLAQPIYDFINLCLPIKKLHPRFNTEGEIDYYLYSS